jgi:hypothetical protein
MDTLQTILKMVSDPNTRQLVALVLATNPELHQMAESAPVSGNLFVITLKLGR